MNRNGLKISKRQSRMERRELFSFLSSATSAQKRELTIRPPYFKEDEDFASCLECDGTCAKVCPESIIMIKEDKTPTLDLTKRGCTYCEECAQACTFDILDQTHKKQLDIVVAIDQNRCLSWQGVMCFSCKDPCYDDAIDFQAMFMPRINEKCTSCGFCIGVCPADAIDIKRRAA